MSCGWIITHDYTGFDKSDVGVMGPRGMNFTEAQIMKGRAFMMKDDDRNIVYRGRIIGKYNGFEPLDDFGMPNAGCTTIWYFLKGKWEEQ